MYAVLGIWNVPGTREERIESLAINVVPFVKTLEGFVDVRWGFDVDSDLGYSYLMFETEAQARHFIEVTAIQRRPIQRENDVQLQQKFVLLDVIQTVSADRAAAA